MQFLYPDFSFGLGLAFLALVCQSCTFVNAALQSGSVEAVIRKHGSREICWSSQGMLRLSTEAMRRLFQPTLERIKQAIGDVLNHPNARGMIRTTQRSLSSCHCMLMTAVLHKKNNVLLMCRVLFLHVGLTG